MAQYSAPVLPDAPNFTGGLIGYFGYDTVRYLEKGTGKVLHEEKYVAENRKSVVTETFQQISGYMPDAYQKRLVLSANAGENVLTFWYTQDSENAYYMIVHWVQNLEGDEGQKHLDEYADGTTQRGKCMLKAICEEMGFDSLGYQSLDGLLEAIGLDKDKVCTYCWNGKE